MPSAYTPSLRLEQQASFENNDTWGDRLNTQVVAMVEQAISGLATIDCTAGGEITLTTANGSTDQARCAILLLTGTPAAAVTIVIPNASKIYLISNGCGQNAGFKTASGAVTAESTLPTATRKFLFCDGANVVWEAVFGQAIAASSVSYAAEGGIPSTTVQTAIASMSIGKVNVNGGSIIGGFCDGPPLGSNDSRIANTAFVVAAINAATAGASGFPSGTRLVFDMDNPPSGWVRDTNPYFNDMAIRFVGNAARSDLAGIGAYSGVFGQRSTDPTGLTAAHLPVHQHDGVTHLGGSHTHTIGYGASFAGELPIGVNVLVGGGTQGSFIPDGGAHQHGFVTNPAGAGQPHAHLLDLRCNTRTVIVGVKQ